MTSPSMDRRFVLLVALLGAVLVAAIPAAGADLTQEGKDTLDQLVEDETGSDVNLEEATDDAATNTITKPADDALLDEAPVVEGRAEGTDLVAVTVEIRTPDGTVEERSEATLDTDGSWSHATDLEAGDYVAVAAVANASGLTASAKVNFTVQPPIDLDVSNPAEGESLHQLDAVDGYVDTNAADLDSLSVEIRSEGRTVVSPEVTVDKSWGRWSAEVGQDLDTGSYTAIVEATDTAGNVVTKRIDFTIEIDVSLSVHDPSDGATMSSLDEVDGSARADGATVDTVEVRIVEDGNVVVSGSSAVGSDWNSWSVSVDEDLPSGSYTAEIEAVSPQAEILKTVSVPFQIETSVDLAISSPGDGATRSSLSEVQGTVSADGTTVGTVAVTVETTGGTTVVGYKEATVDNGVFSTSVPDLAPGTYRVKVAAEVEGVTISDVVEFTIGGGDLAGDVTMTILDPYPGASMTSLDDVCVSVTSLGGTADSVVATVADSSGQTVASGERLIGLTADGSTKACVAIDGDLGDGNFEARVELVTAGQTLVQRSVSFSIDATLSDATSFVECAADEMLSATGECVPLDETFGSLPDDLCQGDIQGDLCGSSDDGRRGACPSGTDAKKPGHEAGGQGRMIKASIEQGSVDTVVGFVDRDRTVLCVQNVDTFSQDVEAGLSDAVPSGWKVAQRIDVDFHRRSGEPAQTDGGGFVVDPQGKLVDAEAIKMLHFTSGESASEDELLSSGTDDLTSGTGSLTSGTDDLTSDGTASSSTASWVQLDRFEGQEFDDAKHRFRTPSFSPFAIAYKPNEGGGGGTEGDDDSTPKSEPSETDEDPSDPEGTDDPSDDGTGDDPSSESTDSSTPFTGDDPIGRFADGEMPWWLYVGVFAASIAVGGGTGWWIRRGRGSDPAEGMPEPTLESFDEGSDDET